MALPVARCYNMFMAFDHRYTQILFEQILAQNEAIFEAVAPSVKDMPKLKAKVDHMIADIKLHRSILKAHENDIQGHLKRLEVLETH